MISPRRFALAILLASLANTFLFAIVFRDSDALFDGAALTAEYWMVPPPSLVVGVAFFSFVWTLAGLTLLLAITLIAMPLGISLRLAKLLFVLGGAGLGWGLFGLLLDSQLPMAVFGTVSALVFTLICPRWFAAWDRPALPKADRRFMKHP